MPLLNSIKLDHFSNEGKQFEKDITAFLQLIRAKEEGGVGGLVTNPAELTNAQSQQVLSAQQQQQMQNKTRQGYNRFDQERYAGKDETGGFGIDTKLTYQPSGGAMALTPNHPNATPQHDSNGAAKTNPLMQQKPNIIQNNVNNVKSAADSSATSAQQMQKRAHTKPIIIH